MGKSVATAVSLRQALRSSPWFVIAVGLHALVLAALSIVYVVQHREVAVAPPPILIAPRIDQPFVDDVPPVQPFDREAIPLDKTTELVPDDELPNFQDTYPQPQDVDLTQSVGDPTAIDPSPPGAPGGTNIGMKLDGPGHRGLQPSVYVSNRLGFGTGHTPGRDTLAPPIITERSVLEGLRWLIRHQQTDGSWSAATLADHCTQGRPCADPNVDYSPQYDPGLTALALLAFLGHGIDGRSKTIIVDEAMGQPHNGGDVVGPGIKWLMAAQGPDGAFTNYPGSLYNEALGALALSEAYAFSRSPQIKAAAENSIRYLVAAQKTNPMSTGRWGWRYTPGGDTIADTSVTGWAVMALKSAQLSGLSVPREALDGALDFTHWVTGKDGLVGYLDPAGAGEKVTGHGDQFDYHTGTMSALGMLVRTFTRHDISDPFLQSAAQHLVSDLPAVSEDHLSVDYYYWYYGSLALMQYDGPDSPRADRGRYWKPWNEAMIAALTGLQDANTERHVCSRGGWLVPDRWSYAGGPIYATALNVLTLEVYYRYPNAFGVRAEPAPSPAIPKPR